MEIYLKNIKEHSEEYSHKFDETNYEYYADNSRFHPIFKFENEFFKKLNTHKAIHNWVDVENLYYYELKKIVKLEKRTEYDTEEELLIDKKNYVSNLIMNFIKQSSCLLII